MNITLNDVIKIIPLDQQTRDDLVSKIDAFSPEVKFEVQQICWGAFHTLREEMIKAKLQQMMDEVERGKRKLTTDMTMEAKQAVWQDFQDILSGKKQEKDQIEALRDKLQSIIEKQKTT